MSELLFFQWTTGILLVSAVTWAAVFAVYMFRRDSPRYHRSGR